MSASATPKLLWFSTVSIPYSDVPPWAEESVRAGFPQLKVIMGDEETISREIGDCEILVTWTLPAEQFARARSLRWIHSPSAGLDKLLTPRLVESDVAVTNARTVHAVPVAEHAIALVLALARNLWECFRHQAERAWGRRQLWQKEHLPQEVNGRTLGLVGFGAIGQEIAARAKGLEMRVVAVKRDPSRGADLADRVYSLQQLPAMLAEADYLVLAAPDTPQTRQLISQEELRRMKPTAYLINVSRGSLVDTEALRKALESGTIAGAGLDVTDPEPLPPEHPLWTTPHVLITHHMGGATDRLWQRQTELLKENLRRYLAGEPLLNLVDKRRGY
jgi:phosphoglycerate dehydrogenase-like enzyme